MGYEEKPRLAALCRRRASLLETTLCLDGFLLYILLTFVIRVISVVLKIIIAEL
jgi:hypothetical protein